MERGGQLETLTEQAPCPPAGQHEATHQLYGSQNTPGSPRRPRRQPPGLTFYAAGGFLWAERRRPLLPLLPPPPVCGGDAMIGSRLPPRKTVALNALTCRLVRHWPPLFAESSVFQKLRNENWPKRYECLSLGRCPIEHETVPLASNIAFICTFFCKKNVLVCTQREQYCTFRVNPGNIKN